MLELRGITLTRNHPVLKEIDLTFSERTIWGIIGRSGVGKTSLLKIAAGLLDTTVGEVWFDGKRLPGPSEKLIPGHEDIQLVNQDFALDLYHTVEENIREKVLSRHKDVQSELIELFLDLVELDHLRKQKALELSGGEQQRLALARALACEPRLLLLDEPFVHLDQRLRWKIQAYLRELNETHGTAIVLVSHDGAEMMGFAEKVIHLRNGVIERMASAEELFFHPSGREEAELMGPVNEVKVNDKLVLFRPNEYVTVDSGIPVTLRSAVNMGLCWMNEVETEDGNIFLLQSDAPLESRLDIRIEKKA